MTWDQAKVLRNHTKSVIHTSNNGLQLNLECSMKDTIKRMKRLATDQEEIFSNHLSDRGPVSKIYKEHSKLNTKKINYPIKKLVKT